MNMQDMSIEDFRNDIAEKVGVSASYLTGETHEELTSQALALIAYKKEHLKEMLTDRPKTTREQFASWLDTIEGTAPERVQDEAPEPEDKSSTAALFEQWMKNNGL